MTVDAAGDVLDNPVWSSITGVHAALAEVVDGAGRYQRDVAPFGALEDPSDPAGWSALAELLDGRATCLLIDPAAVPTGWETVMVIDGVQMDGTALEPADDPTLLELTASDVPEMLALVELTQPGPYLRRTIEMGRYLGIRDPDRDSSLIAMAGERLHPSGWAEISAVCTEPRFRAQGIGTRLVRAIAAGMRDRGERPFLHAAADNVNAIRLYETLGFTLRRRTTFTILRRG